MLQGWREQDVETRARGGAGGEMTVEEGWERAWRRDEKELGGAGRVKEVGKTCSY